ncbi:hypothetical protein [Pseudomonas migulae]|uniref:DUF262 domain-containing protein n=1 Tax=Pseudomonas migulae TaxID=78543 RepID=A0ABY8MMW1_9PSED|nr:hypothetical protein [Pseudomonas migulae]WGK88068.1 hypothetical protein MOQ58_16115 [Pseudomonas migulae]
MTIKIFTKEYDSVIKSVVLTGETTYRFAIDNIFPLINRFSAQRKVQNPAFYDRLRNDILKGCLMPPITLALIEPQEKNFRSVDDASEYANQSVSRGYVLDGMQRLNTLNSIKDHEDFPDEKSLYLSVVISGNKDMLLYRMITLNNGQRPMTPRHQIEVLTEELFDFSGLEIDIQSEKDRGEKIKRGAFNLSDISKGYLAFFTNSVHNENNKIISEKMDEIIVGNIMSTAVVENGLEFQQVLELIDKFAVNEQAKTWLKTQNNLIGFCVGVKTSYEFLNDLGADEFGEYVERFDAAFKSIDAAKVNLGKYRRDLSRKLIEKAPELIGFEELELLTYFSDEIAA